jgi:uncharacterized protein YqeY
MLEDRINQDLKAALLAGDKTLATTLRGLKSVILYAKIADKSDDRGAALGDDLLLSLLQKEAKKRQESADLYKRGGSEEKAAAELAEKAVIERYLPKQLSEGEVAQIVDQAIAVLGATGPAAMGAVIGKVKQTAGPAADGAMIARIAKERLEKRA